jgi:hypothetical protein
MQSLSFVPDSGDFLFYEIDIGFGKHLSCYFSNFRVKIKPVVGSKKSVLGFSVVKLGGQADH